MLALVDRRESQEMSSLLLSPLLTAMTARKGLLSKAEQKDFSAAIDAALPAAIASRRAKLAETYAGIYTEEELAALVGFYESDIGRSIASKQVQVSMIQGLAGASLMFEVAEEAKKGFCPSHPKAKLCTQKPERSASAS